MSSRNSSESTSGSSQRKEEPQGMQRSVCCVKCVRVRRQTERRREAKSRTAERVVISVAFGAHQRVQHVALHHTRNSETNTHLLLSSHTNTHTYLFAAVIRDGPRARVTDTCSSTVQKHGGGLGELRGVGHTNTVGNRIEILRV